MEVQRNGAIIAALRCLQAMRVTQDEETIAALWRAAVKYGTKARRDALLGEIEKSARADHAQSTGGAVRGGHAREA
jgi:hypothetical protein